MATTRRPAYTTKGVLAMPTNDTKKEPTVDPMDATRATLKESVKTLEAEEGRLALELATAKARRKAVEKALKTLEGPVRPRQRRRRTPTAA